MVKFFPVTLYSYCRKFLPNVSSFETLQDTAGYCFSKTWSSVNCPNDAVAEDGAVP